LIENQEDRVDRRIRRESGELKFEEALKFIHGRLKFGSRPGLLRMEAILERVHHPERALSVIHIAGTNGKGSTVAFLRSLLMESDLKVGTFTSPYIESFTERISINGNPIPENKLISYVKDYKPLVEKMDQDERLKGITEFELITAMTFSYFKDEQVDVAIVEVGLGGLYDSTNVVIPDVVGITTIELDHQDILGETLQEIAAQKAGIIKQGVSVVAGNIQSKTMCVIEEVARKKQAKLFRYDVDYSSFYLPTNDFWGERFDYQTNERKFFGLEISMLGIHQTENAAMAIKLAEVYLSLKDNVLSENNIRIGLKNAFWPARMERISSRPLIVLDGAHNEAAMKRLAENLREEFAGRRIKILFSSLETKDVSSMIWQLQEIPKVHLYLTSFNYPRALDLANVSHLVNENLDLVSVWAFGLGDILSKMKENDVLLVTGSLYFVSQVREFLKRNGKVNENSLKTYFSSLSISSPYHF
jgi:dihydrofolate synthase/folylpolyglutamate synthase